MYFCGDLYVMTGKRGRPRKLSTPPWQRAYRERNPTISMVSTPIRKRLLDTIRGEKSYGETFEDFINGKLEPAEVLQKRLDEATEAASKNIKAKNAVIQEKDEKIKELESELENCTITYPCPYCEEELVIRVNDPEVEGIKAYLKREGWAHSECTAKRKKEREKEQARVMRYGALLSKK